MLVVVFDIPETRASDRKQFRRHLRSRNFKPVQRSVWSASQANQLELGQLIEKLNINNYVEVYEATKIYPNQ